MACSGIYAKVCKERWKANNTRSHRRVVAICERAQRYEKRNEDIVTVRLDFDSHCDGF